MDSVEIEEERLEGCRRRVCRAYIQFLDRDLVETRLTSWPKNGPML